MLNKNIIINGEEYAFRKTIREKLHTYVEYRSKNSKKSKIFQNKKWKYSRYNW